MLADLLAQAAERAASQQAPLDQREDAVRLLGLAIDARAIEVLASLVDPQQPENLQIAAIRTLARSSDPAIARPLVSVWRRSTPKVQEEIITVLASRQAWAAELLD